MAFRRRKASSVELGKILDSYRATSPPSAAPAPGVQTIRCWQCGKPNIYDARRPAPRRCSWCKTAITTAIT